MTRINGWDERDYALWSAIRSLPSYGLVANNADNPLLARREILKLLEVAANKRFDATHEIHATEVFSRPECIYNYCPYPDNCESVCQHPAVAPPAGAQKEPQG